MACKDRHCRVNNALLELLPTLTVEDQQRVLERWARLDLAERHALVDELRAPPEMAEPDLVALSKLAQYFQCGIYDMVRYTRGEQ